MADTQVTESPRGSKSRTEAAARVRYRFGDFELTTQPIGLTKRGERIDLAPQPAKVLRLLVASAGEVVSREAIRECLWGSDCYVDHIKGINFVIHQVRSALGEQAAEPVFVETVPRHGYRFAVPVSTTRLRSKPATSPGWRRRLAGGLLPGTALGLGVASLVMTAAFVLYGRPEPAVERVPRLAVVALSESGSGQEEPVPLAAMETLSAYLAASFGPTLKILAPPPGVGAPRQSVLADAQYALSVARFGGETSPNMVIRLTRRRSNAILWTTSAPVGWGELPRLLDEVAEGVASNLNVTASTRQYGEARVFPPSSTISTLERIERTEVRALGPRAAGGFHPSPPWLRGGQLAYYALVRMESKNP